jgi:DNA-binding MarR family transcriptional regulator
MQSDFDLARFLPYLLNQAAEATGQGFQSVYRARHGFSRTQWRVLANLGKFGAMTAAEICKASHMEKTKVSRAVAAMEAGGLLSRAPDAADRRAEFLSLTARGQEVYAELGQEALVYDAALRETLGPQATAALERALALLSARRGGGA